MIPRVAPEQSKQFDMGGRHSTMDSIFASHPAGPGSNHGFGDFFSDVAVLIDSVHCLEQKK